MQCLNSQATSSITDEGNSEQKELDNILTLDTNLEKGPISQYLEKSLSESLHDRSQSSGLLRPIGPVRAALLASGSIQANAVMILEKEFLQNSLRILTNENTTDKLTDAINRTSEVSHLSDVNMTSRELQDGHLYSACMTNPPFYDEDEEVIGIGRIGDVP